MQERMDHLLVGKVFCDEGGMKWLVLHTCLEYSSMLFIDYFLSAPLLGSKSIWYMRTGDL